MPKTQYRDALERLRGGFEKTIQESDELIPGLEAAASIKDPVMHSQVTARLAVLVDRRSEARECLKTILAVLPGEAKGGQNG